ncbi:MAG: hypothetical protein HOF01_09555 [Chloroflexi bacterium]|nr:hypothetical protein [Chloroflexota bacterium]
MFDFKFRRSVLIPLVLLLSLTALTATACGGGDDSDSVQATSAGTAPTATTAAAAPPAATAPTATQSVAPSSGLDNVVIAVLEIPPLIQDPRRDIRASGGIGKDFSIWETIVRAPHVSPPSPPPLDHTNYSPSDNGIAESWEISSDFTSITFKIRPNVPWHDNGGNWGTVDAEDVAWTYNQAFAADSVNNGAEEIGPEMKLGFDVIGPMEVRQNIEVGGFDPTWTWLQGNAAFNGIVIVNKQAFDELGEEAYASTPIGTGRYRVNEWVADDKVELEMVQNHWTGDDAHVKNITLVNMPEAATREAALRVGEIDIGNLPSQTINATVDAIGGTIQEIGIARPQGLQMSGNYWSVDCVDCEGGVMPRPGFEEALATGDFPYIGDPDDPASMESARLVRWAMAMVVDQQSIIDNILDGRGRVIYAWQNILPDDPTHKDEWVIPYDPELARKYMADAGYPDGFDMELWSPGDRDPGFKAAAEATAAMWRKELGIETSIDQTAYSARRPQTVDKTINVPFTHGINWIPGSTSARYVCPNAGHIVGFTLEQSVCDIGMANATEQSLEARIANNIAVQDHMSKWMLFVPMFQAPATLFAVSPRISEWTPYNAQDVFPNRPESIR